jgi:hypothetical protein
MASILFRMFHSVAMMHAGSCRHAIPSQFIARGIVPGTSASFRCNFRQFSQALEPVEATSVCYRGTAAPDKVSASNRHFPTTTAETLQMTLTVAHISPIMSVIAGLLILIMPRLLNFVVAIFLILNGLIGLGLLKWLHM